MTGREIVAEWERRQTAYYYKTYKQSVEDLAKMIDEQSSVVTYEKAETDSYREEQVRWRAAGFDAYNCDMVDEFPRW